MQDSEIYEYCNEVDDIVHFLLICSKVRDFWNVILNWLEHLSETNLKNISKSLSENKGQNTCHQLLHFLY